MGDDTMKDDPDIVRILREEERLGRLTSHSEGIYDQLTVPSESQDKIKDNNHSLNLRKKNNRISNVPILR